MSIHSLVKWLRPLLLVLDSGHLDTEEHGWPVTGVPSEILGETLSLHQLWKLHVPESLCLGNFHWGTHVHLELGFLGCSPLPMCPTQHLIPLQHLNPAESHAQFQCDFCKGKHFSCDTLPCQKPWNLFRYFPACQGELTFPAGEVSSFGAAVLCSWSWHCFVDHQCSLTEPCVLNSIGN